MDITVGYKAYFQPNSTADQYRTLTFTHNSHDQVDIIKQANKIAMKENVVDSYALRKDYWKLTFLEIYVLESPWENVDQLKNQISDQYNTEPVGSNITTTSEYATFKFNQQTYNQIQQDIGNRVPTNHNTKLFRIYLRKIRTIDTSVKHAKSILN